MIEEIAIDTMERHQLSDSARRMYAVVMGMGIACALAIVCVYEFTQPIIERKRIEQRNKVILDVLSTASTSAAFQLQADGRLVPASAGSMDAELVFAGYDEQHNLIGLAIEAQGRGYQDVVRVMYGYSFETEAIIGMRVLESSETPGLGDRIETDSQFRRNFKALDVRLNPKGDELLHTIEFVKRGEKKSQWQIDGVSGATVTSRAVAKMLQESAAKWIPVVYAQRQVFRNPNFDE